MSDMFKWIYQNSFIFNVDILITMIFITVETFVINKEKLSLNHWETLENQE